jgi:hypothetical protein
MTEPSEPRVPSERAPPPASPVPPVLADAVARFDRGDFLGARQAAERHRDDPSPEVQAAARALLARLSPDPWALRFGLLVLIVLALVAGLYVR